MGGEEGIECSKIAYGVCLCSTIRNVQQRENNAFVNCMR